LLHFQAFSVPSHPPDHPPHSGHWLPLALGALLIVIAPLIRGGNRYVALIGLEWLALALLCALAVLYLWGQGRAWGGNRWGLLVLAAAPLWVALVQLPPLPPAWWAAVPGHALYAELLAAQGTAAQWRPLTLTPDATRMALLAGLPLVACFVLALSCTSEQLKTLTRVWMGAALAQALFGLAQLGPFPQLRFGSLFQGTIGTFANSNHYAGFLAMCLPLVVLELRSALVQQGTGRGGVGHAGWLWGLALFVLLVAVVASRSRGGMASAGLVTLATVLLVPGRQAGRFSMGWRLFAAGLVLALTLATVGLDWSRRFDSEVLAGDSAFRWQVLVTTWQAALEFWPLGSGLGSYAFVYPRFQSAWLEGWVEHAHSDYAQLLMECGLLAVLLAGLLLWLLAGQVRWLVAQARSAQGLGSRERLKLACGLGLLALLLHAWVDFNMRIPALAMLGAFLLGAFLRRNPNISVTNRGFFH
jgi:hypothetical protein